MARSQTDSWTTIHGARLNIAPAGNLTSRGYNLGMPCVNATIAIGSENANVRTITVQLLDSYGRDIDYVETFYIGVFADIGRLAFATGGSTGVAIGTDGALLAMVAKKWFVATSEADGDWDGTWTDTGTEEVSIGLLLSTGRWIMSSAFANT